MNYLLINHIPAHPGRDAAHLRLPAAWARDLAAAGQAARGMDVRLTVATPISDRPLADSVELVPDAVGFEHVAIPGYDSARSFLRVRTEQQESLAALVDRADVVQLDHGGYPIPLGLVAAPIVHAADRPALWIVGGDDESLMPRLAHSAGTNVKRLVGHGVDRQLHRRFDAALRDAAVVVTTAAAANQRLRDVATVAVTPIETIDVRDDELPGRAEIAARHARLVDADRPLRLAILGEQTIERGTGHLLAAMHRCWRLRAAVELVFDPRGGEADAVRRHASELGLPIAMIPSTDPTAFRTADVLVDPSLGNSARADVDLAVARGQAPIAYAPHSDSPYVVALARGDVDALAAALFSAAVDRENLAARMLRGVDWARGRTLDAAYRQRFELAATFAGAPA